MTQRLSWEDWSTELMLLWEKTAEGDDERARAIDYFEFYDAWLNGETPAQAMTGAFNTLDDHSAWRQIIKGPLRLQQMLNLWDIASEEERAAFLLHIAPVMEPGTAE